MSEGDEAKDELLGESWAQLSGATRHVGLCSGISSRCSRCSGWPRASNSKGSAASCGHPRPTFGSDVVEPDVEQAVEQEVPRCLDSYPSFEEGRMCHVSVRAQAVATFPVQVGT